MKKNWKVGDWCYFFPRTAEKPKKVRITEIRIKMGEETEYKVEGINNSYFLSGCICSSKKELMIAAKRRCQEAIRYANLVKSETIQEIDKLEDL